MSAPVTLFGYRYSVYTRIARLVLFEKGVAFRAEEIDPFASPPPASLRALHPFGRVPVLRHGDFTLYETAAIARYVDAAFPGPALVPPEPRAAARLAQTVGLIDAYGYRPLVRQVFSHAVFRPAMGAPARADAIESGLAAAGPVLAALETIAAEGVLLDGTAVTLADCHLAPMIDYFLRAAAARPLFDRHPALARWWAAASRRPGLAATDPGLPGPA